MLLMGRSPTADSSITEPHAREGLSLSPLLGSHLLALGLSCHQSFPPLFCLIEWVGSDRPTPAMGRGARLEGLCIGGRTGNAFWISRLLSNGLTT